MTSHVEQQIAHSNAWYTDDQRSNQLGSPGAVWALEGRWHLFDELVRSWFLERPPLGDPLTVLDAGCGDGINLNVLADIVDRLETTAVIVGTDYNPLRLDRAANGDRAPVLQSDLLHTPFRDSTFDLILCSHVIEHIAEDVAALAELGRLLKPNGLIILATPNEGCLVAKLRNHLIQRSILRTTDHVNFYTERELLRRIRMAGLRPIDRTEREGVFLPHLGLSTRLREHKLGRRLLSGLGKAFPSQAAGLVIALTQ